MASPSYLAASPDPRATHADALRLVFSIFSTYCGVWTCGFFEAPLRLLGATTLVGDAPSATRYCAGAPLPCGAVALSRDGRSMGGWEGGREVRNGRTACLARCSLAFVEFPIAR